MPGIGITIAVFKTVCKGKIRRLNHAVAAKGKKSTLAPAGLMSINFSWLRMKRRLRRVFRKGKQKKGK